MGCYVTAIKHLQLNVSVLHSDIISPFNANSIFSQLHNKSMEETSKILLFYPEFSLFNFFQHFLLLCFNTWLNYLNLGLCILNVNVSFVQPFILYLYVQTIFPLNFPSFSKISFIVIQPTFAQYFINISFKYHIHIKFCYIKCIQRYFISLYYICTPRIMQ